MTDKRANIKKIIMDIKTLPTLPGIILRLKDLSENNKASLPEIAKLLTSDPVLSARILRLANSPFYGLYRVSTVSKAMIILGVNVVKNLALSCVFFEVIAKDSIDLWEHSLGVGMTANMIACKLDLPEREEIATAGLLHDLGKALILLKCKDISEEIHELISQEELYTFEAERQIMGTDHAEIGAWLAKSWFMPDKLIDPIAFHHNVNMSANHKVKTAVVHVADALVKASGFNDSSDPFVPQIQQAAWNILKISDQQLSEIVEEMEDLLMEAKNLSVEIQL